MRVAQDFLFLDRSSDTFRKNPEYTHSGSEGSEESENISGSFGKVGVCSQ